MSLFSTLKQRFSRPSYLVMAGIALLGLVFVGVADPTLAGQVLYSVMAIMAFAFAYIYASGSNWRSTAPGRALLYLVAMFAALSAWLSVSFWLGPGYDDEKAIVRGVLLVVLIVMFVNLVVTVWRIQRYRPDQDEIDSQRERVCPKSQGTDEA